jgi:hypothetical protein
MKYLLSVLWCLQAALSANATNIQEGVELVKGVEAVVHEAVFLTDVNNATKTTTNNISFRFF